jgi:orotidine-5'-phosphate decarboxylase
VALDVPHRQEALALVQELRGVVTTFKVGLELIVGGGVPRGRRRASPRISASSWT